MIKKPNWIFISNCKIVEINSLNCQRFDYRKASDYHRKFRILLVENWRFSYYFFGDFSQPSLETIVLDPALRWRQPFISLTPTQSQTICRWRGATGRYTPAHGWLLSLAGRSTSLYSQVLSCFLFKIFLIFNFLFYFEYFLFYFEYFLFYFENFLFYFENFLFYFEYFLFYSEYFLF